MILLRKVGPQGVGGEEVKNFREKPFTNTKLTKGAWYLPVKKMNKYWKIS